MRLSTFEPKTTVGQSLSFAKHLAVKAQAGEAPILDGPLLSERASLPDLIASPTDAAVESQATDYTQAVSSIHAEQTECAAQRSHLDAKAERPIRSAEPCVDQYAWSVLDADEAHGQYSQAQRDAIMDPQAPEGGLLPISKCTASRRSKTSISYPALKPTQLQHARHPVQQLVSNNKTDHLASVDHPTPTRSTQEVLHGASSRSGSVRVTKTHRPTQTVYDPHSKISAANDGHQMRSRTAALDMALNTFRTACLADQYHLEDRMASRENGWNDERNYFQTTITEQMEIIAGQRIKLEQSEKRFIYLTEKLQSSQMFVSGLQKDQAKLQKAMVATQEQNKRTLQDQIAEMLTEKEALQVQLKIMVDSCAKSQKSMFKTMNELYLRYVTTLSRENDLKGRLGEQVTMYEEEKNRRTELEQQLLPSFQDLQRHLNESSAKLAEEVSSLRHTTESRASEDPSHFTTKECLLILQELQSLPLLTSNDVRDVEAPLWSLHERQVMGKVILLLVLTMQ